MLQKWINRLRPYREAIMYLIFGGLTTLVNFIVFLTLRAFSVDLMVTNVIAWICAVLFAYLTNRRWVFVSEAKDGKALLREILSFYGARVFSLLIELGLFQVWAILLAPALSLQEDLTAEAVVKLALQVVVIVLNYIFSKFIVFRRPKQEQAKKDPPGPASSAKTGSVPEKDGF